MPVTIGLAVAASVLAYPAILILFGEEWVGSVVPFVILSLATAAFAIEVPLRTYRIRMQGPGAFRFTHSQRSAPTLR